MIKKDLGGLGFPFFEQKLENGISVLFLPTKSRLKSAKIMVSAGAFSRVEKIDNIAIPFGSAHVLSAVLMSEDFKKELLKEKIVASAEVDYSYTIYSLDTMDDLYKGISLLMDRIAFATIKEEDVRSACASDRYERSDLEKAELLCMENLYTGSPIKNGIRPTEEQSNKIHASGLKKFKESYYTPDRISILVCADDVPSQVVEKIREMHFPVKKTVQEQFLNYQEDYDSVSKEFTVKKIAESQSILTYGVKLPARADQYEAFGEMLFSIYQILPEVLITKNPIFLKAMEEIKAEVISCEIKQGFEDACLLIDLSVGDKDKCLNVITDYLSRCTKFVENKTFKDVLRMYTASAVASLASTHDALDGFCSALADHLPYTGVVSQTNKMKFSYLNNYLKELQGFRRAAAYIIEEDR